MGIPGHIVLKNIGLEFAQDQAQRATGKGIACLEASWGRTCPSTSSVITEIKISIVLLHLSNAALSW